jgi:hypothetical protein
MSAKGWLSIALVVAISQCLDAPALAWKSALPSTHRPITVEAISLLQGSGEDYQDITRFQTDIADWSSGILDDGAAHGAYSDDGWTGYGWSEAVKYNGGPFDRWWVILQDRYSTFAFNNGDRSAYYYAGLMAHLIEDQAVPPHAANVSHSLWDDIEYWVWQVERTQPPVSGVWYWTNRHLQ